MVTVGVLERNRPQLVRFLWCRRLTAFLSELKDTFNWYSIYGQGVARQEGVSFTLRFWPLSPSLHVGDVSATVLSSTASAVAFFVSIACRDNHR